jgi:hypothetical protein
MAPTCTQGCFLFFEGVSQLADANMPPRDVCYLFEGVGVWFPIKLPNSSHWVPLVLINIPSKSSFSHQIPKKFSSITHQNSFVPIKFQSNFFCSHQVPKKFSLHSSCSYQYPFVFIKFPNNSHQIPLVPINFLLFSSLWRIGKWTQRWTMRLVRDSSWVLTGAP